MLLNWSGLSARGYLPVIQKYLWHICKEGSPFARDFPLGNLEDSNISFWLALLHSVFFSFFLRQSPGSCLCTVLYAISSNIDKTTLLIYLSLEILTSIVRTDWSILVELLDLVRSVIFFLSPKNLTQIVNFLTRSLNCDAHSCALFNSSISSAVAFHWEIWSCCCLSFHWLYFKLNGGYPSHTFSLLSFWLFLCWLAWFCDILRNFTLDDIFDLGAFAAASEFCAWIKTGTDL